MSRAHDPDKKNGRLHGGAHSERARRAGALSAGATDMVDIQGFMTGLDPEVMEFTPNPVFDFDTEATIVSEAAFERTFFL